MDIVASRRHFNVTEKDKVMFNGACYQLMTQTYFKDWNRMCPIIATSKAEKLIAQNKLVYIGEKKTWTGLVVKYYKFANLEEKVEI